MAPGVLAKEGHQLTAASKLAANGARNAKELGSKESAVHDKVLKTFRLLIADLCQQFNGGHPG